MYKTLGIVAYPVNGFRSWCSIFYMLESFHILFHLVDPKSTNLVKSRMFQMANSRCLCTCDHILQRNWNETTREKIKGRIVFFKDIIKVSIDNRYKDPLNGVLFLVSRHIDYREHWIAVPDHYYVILSSFKIVMIFTRDFWKKKNWKYIRKWVLSARYLKTGYLWKTLFRRRISTFVSYKCWDFMRGFCGFTYLNKRLTSTQAMPVKSGWKLNPSLSSWQRNIAALFFQLIL